MHAKQKIEEPQKARADPPILYSLMRLHRLSSPHCSDRLLVLVLELRNAHIACCQEKNRPCYLTLNLVTNSKKNLLLDTFAYSFSLLFFLGKRWLVRRPNLTRDSISGTSIKGPITVAKAAPELRP